MFTRSLWSVTPMRVSPHCSMPWSRPRLTPPTSCLLRWIPPRGSCIWARRQTSVSLSDTVGLIRDLPHGLVDAFQATLQEAVDADLLLHVVDAANPDLPVSRLAKCSRVLAEIGACAIPQVLVFNKLDAIEPGAAPLAVARHLRSGWADGAPYFCECCANGKGLAAAA